MFQFRTARITFQEADWSRFPATRTVTDLFRVLVVPDHFPEGYQDDEVAGALWEGGIRNFKVISWRWA